MYFHRHFFLSSQTPWILGNRFNKICSKISQVGRNKNNVRKGTKTVQLFSQFRPRPLECYHTLLVRSLCLWVLTLFLVTCGLFRWVSEEKWTAWETFLFFNPDFSFKSCFTEIQRNYNCTFVVTFCSWTHPQNLLLMDKHEFLSCNYTNSPIQDGLVYQ